MDKQPSLEKVSLDIETIERIRNELGLGTFPNARFSTYFTLLLWQIKTTNSLSTHSIIREIQTLESGETSAYTKMAKAFTGTYLRGLWHKHFTDASFLLKNMRNEWDHNDMLLNGLQEIAREHSGQEVGKEIVGKITHMAVLSALENRGNEDRMTGEWIVFAPYQGRNYYLAISNHKTEGASQPQHDQALRAEILTNCGWEFPFLSDILGTEPESEKP